MPTRKKSAPPVKRNFAAKGATNQKAGAMKTKRDGKGGAKNQFREDLSKANNES